MSSSNGGHQMSSSNGGHQSRLNSFAMSQDSRNNSFSNSQTSRNNIPQKLMAPVATICHLAQTATMQIRRAIAEPKKGEA